MKKIVLIFGVVLLGLAAVSATAQTTTVTTTTTTTAASSATDAVRVAKDGVDPSLRDHVVSVYGVGTPAAIQTWWVIFYDPSVASHGRAVKVENGAITKTYEAKSGGVVYDNQLTFAPAQVTGEGPALAAAQNYAAQHAIAYDSVRVLLRNTTADQAFRWRVELMNGASNKGFVFANTTDGSFAMYAPAGSVSTHTSASTGGVAGDVEHAANQVKNTFLGIGGDLQEFFTGERTVDQ